MPTTAKPINESNGAAKPNGRAKPSDDDAPGVDLADVVRELRLLRAALATGQSAALGRKAAARYLSLSPASLDRLASAGKLKPVRISAGRVAWRRADLDAFLEGLS